MKLLYTLSIISLVIVCLQPTQAFNISIVAGPNQTQSTVQVSGQDVHITTPSEAIAFNLTSQNIMQYTTGLAGRAPNDYAFSDPTDNGNNYAIYGFPQVQTTLTAVKAEIVSFTTQTIILAQKTYENNSTDVVTFDGNISDNVTNTVKNSWSKTSTFTATQTINYGISFLGGSTSISYSHGFQQSYTKSQAITVGTDSGFTVTVQPGQVIDASLSSAQGTMTVRVYFEATLSGDLYYHCDNPCNGHYYFFDDVNDVTNMIPVVTITEDITVNFFSESQVLLQSPNDTAPTGSDASVSQDAVQENFLA